MKTERMTILVTAEEKRSIATRAEILNIPASELVRRAVAHYDPSEDEENLAALAKELAAVVDATERKLDDALVELRELRKICPV